MLRGVYFVSGTQEGTPIDRVLGSVARRYQLEQAILPAQQSSGRSFFLSRLLTDVVFAEHGLAGTTPWLGAAARRAGDRRLWRAGFAACWVLPWLGR
jgi:type VI protein secretion system component VasK